MSEIGEVSVTEDLRMLAMSRIYLDNIPHIKAYWVMYGKATTELALAFGAADIGDDHGGDAPHRRGSQLPARRTRHLLPRNRITRLPETDETDRSVPLDRADP